MIVIERDGRTIVIAEWVVMTAVLAALAFLVVGIALSVAALLLIVMPAVAIVLRPAQAFGLAGHGRPRKTGSRLLSYLDKAIEPYLKT